MPSAKISGTVALLCILGLALVWRLPLQEREWQLMFCESDSLFQLHRIHQCLQRYPHVQSVDRYSHYPRGYRVPWINLHTLLYATLAKVLGSPSDLDALAKRLSWVPPILGVGGILLAVAITRRVTTNRLCVLAVALLCAISAEVARPFLYGIIDHHLFAHLGVLLLVLARLRRAGVLWVAGLVALIAMTPEAPIFVSLMLGCLFLSDAAALILRTEPRPSSWGWYFSPAAVAAVAWLAHRAIDTTPLPPWALDWTYLTLFHPLWFVSLGGGLRAALAAVMSSRQDPRPAGAFSAFLAVAAFVAGGMLLLRWSGAFELIVQRLLTPNRVFVGEEAFVFQAGFWNAPAWYRIVAISGVFLLVKLVQAWRRREGADRLFLWITLLAAVLVGFKEFRHLYVLSTLQLIGLGLAVFEVERALRGLPVFSGRLTRVLPAAAFAAAIIPFVFLNEVPNRTALGDVCDGFPVIRQLTGWLAHSTPNPQPLGQARPTYGVFSPWSIGHHINVLGNRPVIVDPLNYDVEGRFDDALEAVWGAKAADDLTAALERYGVRYVVLTNPAEEIVGLLRRHNVSKDTLVKINPDDSIVFLPALYQYAAFRLFMSRGAATEFHRLQPRFFSTESATYTSAAAAGGQKNEVVVPDGQIYELVPSG